MERAAKRTPEEEKILLDLLKEGIMRCYFCDKEITEEDDYSTEYGVFYACTDCWTKWGNPDDEIGE